MALGLSVLVSVAGWDDFGDAVVAHAHVPAFMLGGAIRVRVRFDESVVGGADEGGVVETGGSALLPGCDVVGVAVAWFPITPGEHTPPVPDGDGLPHVTAEQSGGPTQVEELGVRPHDGGEDVRVAGEPSCLTGADPGVRPHQGRAADTTEQVVIVDQDDCEYERVATGRAWPF